MKTIDAWLASQNLGIFSAYEALYLDTMTGVRRVGERATQFDRAGWMVDRKRMFEHSMKVTIRDVVVSGTAYAPVVDLVQSFQQGSFSDEGPKRIVLARTDGGLRIAREEMLSSTVISRSPPKPKPPKPPKPPRPVPPDREPPLSPEERLRLRSWVASEPPRKLMDAVECRGGFPAPTCEAAWFDHEGDLAVDRRGAKPAVSSGTLAGFPAIHAAAFVNDGQYGNGSSWVSDRPNGWIKIDFQRSVVLTGIRLGRDRLLAGRPADRDPGRIVVSLARGDASYADGDDRDDAMEYEVVFDSALHHHPGTLRPGETLRIGFVTTTARYLKVQVEREGAALDEIEAYPGNEPIAAASYCGSVVRLRSWKNDFLARADGAEGVTSAAGGPATEWRLACDGGTATLRSTRGDHLLRAPGAGGVTTGPAVAGSAWTIVGQDSYVLLRSNAGDHLHRPDLPAGVGLYDATHGSQWRIEPVLDPAGERFVGGIRVVDPVVDRPDTSVFAHFFPREVRFGYGENCHAPWSEPAGGVVLFRAAPHPRNPKAMMVAYLLLLRRDCGLLGHVGAPGADNHYGDAERIYMTLVPDASCAKGWRLWAMRTVAHDGARKYRDVWQSNPNSCDPPDSVVMSVGKHAVFDTRGHCLLHGESCTEGTAPSAAPRVLDVVTMDERSPVNDLSALFPPEGKAPREYLFGGDGKFCGGADVGDRSKDCISSPVDHLRFDEAGFDADYIPDPQLGDDVKCYYGQRLQAGLCYDTCRPGYSGFVTMCVPGCPSGFRDDGLYCYKPSAYGRGAGYPWKFGDSMNLNAARRRCEKANPQGCEKNGAIIYPKCRAGFHAVGCCICSPDCPSKTTDIGISCQKHTYDRGVGSFPIADP